MKRTLTIAVAVLACSSSAQLTADPQGKGYMLTLGEWLQPGQSCSIDLDRLSITPTSLAGRVGPTTFPLKGEGVLKLQSVNSGYAKKDWALAELPPDWKSLTSIHVSMPIAGPDGRWTERAFDSHVIAPSERIPRPVSAVGQGFVVLPDERLPAFQEHGRPASDFVLRPLVLSKIAPGALAFTVTGTARVLTLKTHQPPLAIDDLEPTVEDEGIRHLRDRYRGRCWAYPGAVSALNPNGLDRPFDSQFKPLKIRALVRLWRSRTVAVTGVIDGIGGNGDQALWGAVHPILAVLQPTGGRVDTNAPMMLTSDNPKEDTVAASEKEFARRINPKLYTLHLSLALDDWHMRRMLSETPPGKDLKGASKAIRKSLYRGEMTKGMTYRQLAWVRGWPMLAGTPEQIVSRRLDAWEYPSVVFTDTAVFSHGRFVGYSVYRLP